MNQQQRLESWRREFEGLALACDTEALLETDPVHFLHFYSDPAWLERLAFLASGLAFGGVAQIKVSIARVLDRTGPFIESGHWPAAPVLQALTGIKHRWATGLDVAVLLLGLDRVAAGRPLSSVFVAHETEPDYVGALAEFRDLILAAGREAAGLTDPSVKAGEALLPDPRRGGACKRLHLALRWLVRKDAIDIGIWPALSRKKLLIPVDVHVFRISRRLGICNRNSADLAASREITAFFRQLDPDDPARFDFALTRMGMLGTCGAKANCSDCNLAGLCRGPV